MAGRMKAQKGRDYSPHAWQDVYDLYGFDSALRWEPPWKTTITHMVVEATP